VNLASVLQSRLGVGGVVDLGGLSLFIKSDGVIITPSYMRELVTTGTGDITLIARNMNFASAFSRIRAHHIRVLATGRIGRGGRYINLNRDFTFSAEGGLQLAGDLRSARTLHLVSGSADAVATNRSLTLRAANINISANLDAGMQDLNMIAGGQIRFTSTGAVALGGGNITLSAGSSAVAPSASNIAIRATGDVNLNTSIITTGTLEIEAGSGDGMGGINVDIRRTTRLSAASINLMADEAPTASNQDLYLTTTGPLTLNADVNTGIGVLRVSAASIAGTATINSIETNPALQVGSAAMLCSDITGYTCSAQSP